MKREDPIVSAIGEDIFRWLAQSFNEKTALNDVPDDILDRIASVDITIRNYAGDPDSILAIALITFAYKLAGKVQHAAFGGKDILLVKVLAKKERARRQGGNGPPEEFWRLPLYELIAGDVGDRMRLTPMMNSPTDTHG